MLPRYRRVFGFAFGFIIVIIVLLISIMAITTEPTAENTPHNKRSSGEQEYYNRRGIHVVVGHYLGESSAQVPNLTKELINSNMYHPIAGAGENGSPVQIPSMEMLKMRQLYPINRFNLLASDKISINRSLPDPRKQDCIGKYDYRDLPDTSIIIVFHNEAWSTLLRTVYSAINRSPPKLIREILLVDDASNRDFLKKPLEDLVTQMPINVRVLRSHERIGLTRARMLGAREAKGQVLTFLDAHCECTIGWLEPLLSRVAENRKKVVCPVIDIINDDTFAYIRSFDFHWGAFNWEMHFRWYSIGRSEMEHRKKDLTEPFRTPAMAGGLFSMDREYFFELGGYDEDLEIWGGENLEMSFRVWMCGGSVEIAPCSHVAHLFRKSSPYSFPNGVTHVLYGNLARVALVWMDQWKEFFFKFNPEAAKIRNELNVKPRLQLRNKLNCHSFKWYLEHIWPQHFLPTSNRFFGKIRHMPSGRCLQRPSMSVNGGNHPTELPSLVECKDKPSLKQMFLMTPEGFIMTDESLCLVATSKVNLEKIEYTVRMLTCTGSSKQKWIRIQKTKVIQHITSNKCLEYDTQKNLAVHLVLNACDTNIIDQRWELDPVPWK